MPKRRAMCPRCLESGLDRDGKSKCPKCNGWGQIVVDVPHPTPNRYTSSNRARKDTEK